MKRFLALALTCLLAACGTQQRPDNEPDFSSEPHTPDESQEPRLGEIESLISQAKLEIKRRDYDEARVKLHQVFRRDRWHPEANTIYQDLQISRGKGDALYQEYLDLYEANKQRGDALWFHLRPLLIKRGIKACEAEMYPKPTEEHLVRIGEIRRSLGQGMTGDSRAPKELSESERLALIDEWLVLDPWDGSAVRLRTELKPKETIQRYKARADDEPSSGNAQWLYAMSVRGLGTEESDVDSLDILRRAWILELPGVTLRASIAGMSVVNANRWLPVSRERLKKATETYGWLELALHFYRIADLTEPERGYGQMIKDRILDVASENSIELEDLSMKK